MGWGFMVPFFPIVGFLGLIVGLGLRVQLWHVLGIKVTVEFFTWVNEVFHGPGWPTRPCLQVLFCVLLHSRGKIFQKVPGYKAAGSFVCVLWPTQPMIHCVWYERKPRARNVLPFQWQSKLRGGAQLVSYEENHIKWCHFASRLQGRAVSMLKWKHFGNNFSAWKIPLLLVY